MKPVLLDASCVLAAMFDEPGGSDVESILGTSFIASANMAEVAGVVDRKGGKGAAIVDDLVSLGLTVLPIGLREVRAVSLVQSVAGPSARLALGDVLCLASAVSHDIEVWTADRAWRELRLPIGITVIR